MKKVLKICILLLLAGMTLTGCVSKYKKIKVTSFELESVVPSSLRSANVVVDVGIHRVPDESKKSGYRIIGDVKHSEVDKLCSWVTPVPGGVGPLTIVSLLENTMKAYKRQLGIS